MSTTTEKDIAVLLMYCPDQKGIVASVTSFLQENKGNVIYLDQHVDTERKMFFMRLEVELDDFVVPKDKIRDYFQTLIASRYSMTFKLFFKSHIHRMAVFVSKMSHCLFDILSRRQSGEWEIEIPVIISNHKNLEPIAQSFGIPFEYLPIARDNKAEQEKKQIAILEKHQIDLIVLARYMQIISPDFIKAYPDKIINIHHSFLPAFIGARPYHAAHERGVKIIGATSHYVTEELDAGPIIDQGVTRVSHKDSVKDLIRKGKDLEKIVLSRAIWNHINHKLLHFENRTIIFD
ncbi:formyltetrahydrofolate deformylase [Flammeovirgaceae bacterium SG7u.111]|nr:formyltetrahydrofolate deformylase [Flammeovirgaceae bacterium SG7u.132]WPO35273.1 formyltetrahydrofolate deformylase [Flammeovirgaceae bacterium SG7u.111]